MFSLWQDVCFQAFATGRQVEWKFTEIWRDLIVYLLINSPIESHIALVSYALALNGHQLMQRESNWTFLMLELFLLKHILTALCI